MAGFLVRPVVAASPEPDGGAPAPEQIYVRAVRAMRAAPQPAFVTFRETVVGRNFVLHCTRDALEVSLHHGDVRAVFDVAFRTSDGAAVSRPVGVPDAVSCPGALLAPAGSIVAGLGVPPPSPAPRAAPAPVADAAVGPPLIAAVRVDAATSYRIALTGLERLGDADAYHLTLHAYRDPRAHPLTDLFVDPQTFLVREARGEVEGRFVVGSGRLAGIVDFDRIGAYWLVDRLRFDVAANALFVHARMTSTIDAADVATPDDVPNVAFPTPKPVAPKR